MGTQEREAHAMARRNLGTMAALALLAGMLGACQTSLPPPPRFADIALGNEAPIRLNVATVDVVDEYLPPLKAPNVDHEFPVKIATTAARWGDQRLRAVGNSGSVRVTIKDASAIATDLPKTSGLTGMFTNQQAVRYDARVEMIVEIRDDHGFAVASAEAAATRSRTVPEDITLNGRDRVFYEMTEALMKDEDAALSKNIHAFMQRYIQ
jgi:hypothetical protein